MGAPPSSDPREELWSAAYGTYYDTLFEEITADSLITRWAWVDETTKILVMVTASSSAVSGWALWDQPGYRSVWLVVSGLAALLSVVHTALGIPGRIRTHAEDKRRFAGLRTDLETFRYTMRVQRDDFDVDDFTAEFREYRKRYSEDVQLLANDIARTSGLELKMQSEVNARLRDETVQ